VSAVVGGKRLGAAAHLAGLRRAAARVDWRDPFTLTVLGIALVLA